LKNEKGFHVWTRWGRNGTDGQSKLEGPLSEEDAEKNFKKKFQDKTKNKWDKRQQFTAVKGKYTLVQKTDSSQSSVVTESQISTTNLSVHEDFLGMYKLKKTDAETITTSLKDILLRCNLTIDDCRWQTYDGAANMAGSRSGVAARISLENPRALYIHCGNHSLDLALHDCVKESGII
ncbi:Hypothetical predicted protein, partial [Paramuricea clavata]